MARVAWIDASMGVAGDMLLGALAELGALGELPNLLDSLDIDATVEVTSTTRRGLAATTVTVTAPDDQPTRRLADIVAIISVAQATESVKKRAIATFSRLADAEAEVHGTSRDDVHFHEVGAVDTIVDVLGACLGFDYLGVDELVVSLISLGGGSATTSHGIIPIPGPAVVELLKASNLTSTGGPVDVELATPTGVALLAEFATGSGPMPPMAIEQSGSGAGSREFTDRANLLRIVTGSTVDDADSWLIIETNVDDLDPRLWPGVIDALLKAGAGDAWLTPILMKKGRPAHTLHALAPAANAAAVRAEIFRTTSTIGVREQPIDKHHLDRTWQEATVAGETIRIKVSSSGGTVITATPEWVDVQSAAVATGKSEKEILQQATAEAAKLTR